MRYVVALAFAVTSFAAPSAHGQAAAPPQSPAAVTAKAAPGYEGKQDVLLGQLKADIASTFASDDTKVRLHPKCATSR